ncbi:MAG: VOC family protein [Pseudomonadota bacterium]
MTQAIRIRHLGIVVKNLNRAMWFYKELLGLELQHRMVENGPYIDNVLALRGVEVETVKLGTKKGITQIELMSFGSHTVSVAESERMLRVGPTHVAFTVDNLQTLYTEMKAQGIEFNCPPQNSPDGKVLLTYCKDPDGTLVELVEIL